METELDIETDKIESLAHSTSDNLVLAFILAKSTNNQPALYYCLDAVRFFHRSDDIKPILATIFDIAPEIIYACHHEVFMKTHELDIFILSRLTTIINDVLYYDSICYRLFLDRLIQVIIENIETVSIDITQIYQLLSTTTFELREVIGLLSKCEIKGLCTDNEWIEFLIHKSKIKLEKYCYTGDQLVLSWQYKEYKSSQIDTNTIIDHIYLATKILERYTVKFNFEKFKTVYDLIKNTLDTDTIVQHLKYSILPRKHLKLCTDYLLSIQTKHKKRYKGVVSTRNTKLRKFNKLIK